MNAVLNVRNDGKYREQNRADKWNGTGKEAVLTGSPGQDALAEDLDRNGQCSKQIVHGLDGSKHERIERSDKMLQSLAGVLVGFALVFQSWAYIMPHQNPLDTLILVNKQNRAPSVPLMLVKPNVDPTEEKISENIYMRPDAAAALEEMFAAALQDGIKLYALSGYRSYSTQKAIYERKGRSESRISSVAKQGYSEHQTGLAMDFQGESTKKKGLVAEIGESPEGIWVAEHCYEYGFIIRYPKDKGYITGYIYEPWHVRYVGVEAAMEIKALDVTFEEYIAMVRRDRIIYLEQEEPAGEQKLPYDTLPDLASDPDSELQGGDTGSGDYGKRGRSSDIY